MTSADKATDSTLFNVGLLFIVDYSVSRKMSSSLKRCDRCMTSLNKLRCTLLCQDSAHQTSSGHCGLEEQATLGKYDLLDGVDTTTGFHDYGEIRTRGGRDATNSHSQL